jgi:hypothetical protein
MQSVLITINVVIKFICDLRLVGDFLRFPPPIKLTDITEILLKVVLSTITLTLTRFCYIRAQKKRGHRPSVVLVDRSF